MRALSVIIRNCINIQVTLVPVGFLDTHGWISGCDDFEDILCVVLVRKLTGNIRLFPVELSPRLEEKRTFEMVPFGARLDDFTNVT